uniref:MAM domain-containing protein n=1 Tax=Soboliphyme baturini TaxID=241478 RepID=A0A183J146_9BILA
LLEIGSFNKNPIGFLPTPPVFGRTSSEADCIFDGRCAWFNVRGDNFDWDIITEKVNPIMWQQATKTKGTPDGGFAMLSPQTMGDLGYGDLVSLPFYCQQGDGALSFNYWKSGSVQPEICVVLLGQKVPLFCRGIQAEDPLGRYTVPIPGPIQRPYQLVIRGTSQKVGRNNFIAVDNIQYKADVCGSNPMSGDYNMVCQAITCNFRTGTSCNWILNTGGMSGSQFALSNRPIGVANNVLVSPSVLGEYFLGTVIRDPNQPVAVLQSADFKLQKPLVMMLALKRSTWGSEVYVCFDEFFPTLDDCKLLAGPSLSVEEATNVKRIYTAVPAGTEKVFIVAKHPSIGVSGPAAFGIEDIELVDANRRSLCL